MRRHVLRRTAAHGVPVPGVTSAVDSLDRTGRGGVARPVRRGRWAYRRTRDPSALRVAMRRSHAIAAGVFVILVHAVAYLGNGLWSSPLASGWDPVATAEATPLARWDAGWYRSIAADGYFWDETTGVGNVAFFPLFPILVRVLSASGLPLFWAATVLAHAGFVAAVILLERCRELRRGTAGDPSPLLALLAFPWAFFLLAPYSESLFLALALGAFVAALRGRWGLVALLGFCAGLT
ncbi:MAG: hypothetical protein K8J08_14405, partial [Thermoanaerobaculia bacterium]|nr:hypothetical protein [Thermoanaerobaculia bacterium]